MSLELKAYFLCSTHSWLTPYLNRVLNRLHELSYNIAFHSYSDEACNPSTQQRSVLFQQLNNQVNILYGSYGTMERIKNTPLPFVYVIHLRTFLLLYLFLWNMTSVASSGWIALPALFAFNWSLLGYVTQSIVPFYRFSQTLTLLLSPESKQHL